MVFFWNGRSIIPRRKCGPGKKALDGHSIENGLALSVFTFPRRNGTPYSYIILSKVNSLGLFVMLSFAAFSYLHFSAAGQEF